MTEEQVKLISEYKLVYPSDPSETFFESILSLQADIVEVAGTVLELSTDFVKDEAENIGVKEILVGNTFRGETQAVMNDIGYYDYAIKSVGNKVVIAAHTEQMLYRAMSEFVQKALVSTGKGMAIGDDVYYQSQTKGFFEKYGDISEYRIVYPTGHTQFAKLAEDMSVALKKHYKVELPIVTDSESPNGYEILLGSTNRAVFVDYYRGDKKPDAIHYSICAREGNILVYGGSEHASKISCQRFIEDFKQLEWSSRFELPSDFEVEFVAYDKNDADVNRSEDADLRIMSYNILMTDFALRAEQVFSIILNYAPDVVGLQEISDVGYKLIEEHLGDKYATPLKKTPNNDHSFTGLIYNRETVRYIEGGNHVYSVGNKQIRIISWGLMEMKASGEQFIAISTHWDVVYDNRPQQAVQMTDYVNNLKKQYNCPIITTGDYNTKDGAFIYTNYLECTGQADARFAAKVIAHASEEAVIDHITATVADIEPLFFKLLDTEFTDAASDHDPIYADYKFK